ncbi:ribosomal RNA large subunit methyltransferase J [Mycena belliarum]|uniref:rRNA methyltransferase 2, mitochondrial n=1 Tax=Mycena belliarum TaxID=1033014 RepID=A0AAD6XLS6_9AGAR|nr:ribosomal RNA large subunit methyltransferase J [Mycena belliae]
MPFRPSSLVCAQKSSSKVWLARQSRDPYVKLRSSPDAAAAVAATSYRSRSAFKLLEMDEKWHFLDKGDVQVVLDLGAAPGGWSQVVAQKLGWDRPPPALGKAARMREPNGWEGAAWSAPPADAPDAGFDPLNISGLEGRGGVGRGTIIAVDLLRMAPILGVLALQADFLAPETEALMRGVIVRARGPDARADVVLCDMAANSTGNAFHDIEASLAICTSVFEFSRQHLRPARSIGRDLGGVLLIKHFVHPLLHMFRREHLEPRFNDVRFLKPNASRTESKEGYFLCRGWKG